MTMLRCAVVFVLALSVACGSRNETIAQRAQEIEGQVWSPYCPGRLLIDCTTTQSRQLRARIERELRNGRSEDEVLARIGRDFGRESLARPPSGRSGISIWLVPVVIFGLGVIFVALILRRRRGRATEQVAAPPSANLKRLREEVEREI